MSKGYDIKVTKNEIQIALKLINMFNFTYT